MSFSKILKNAQTSVQVPTAASSASVMTLSLIDEGNTPIAAYYEEEYTRDNVKYKWFDDFRDEKYSTVDIDKNITVEAHQANITQEQNSQFIPFKIPRYWDGVDLTQMTFWIHYENKDKKCGNTNPINFQYNSESILFGWLVDLNVTYLPGVVSFEIIANGTISNGENTLDYTWRTKPNGKINILESLTCSHDPIVPNKDWTTDVLSQMSTMLNSAQQAVDEAKRYADEAKDSALNVNEVIINDAVERAIIEADARYSTIENFNAVSSLVDKKADKTELDTVDNDLRTLVSMELSKHYTKDEVDTLLNEIDISSQLTGIEGRVENLETEFENFDGLAALDVKYDGANTLSFYNGEELIKNIILNTNPSSAWVAAYDTKMDQKISDVVTPVKEGLDTYKEQTDADLKNIHENIDNLPSTLESDYYKKSKTDELLGVKADKTEVESIVSTANTNKSDISTLSTKVVELDTAIKGIDVSPRLSYEATYVEQVFTLWETEGDGEPTEKSKFTITGGSGGSSTSSSLKIEYVTKTPLVVTVDDKALITFKFSGTDSSGDDVLEGQATWKVAGNVVATSVVVNGENSFDITDYLSIGTQKVQLSIVDDAGSLVTKSWTVQKVDVRLESSFNDTFTYPLGVVSFAYTPYGAIEKDVHFILDGKEIGTVTTSASGIPMAYTLPSQEHGSHLLEVYMTATVNGNTIKSNRIVKDILWYDETTGIPVIGCTKQEFTETQYATTNIVYTVYDPSTETPEVVIAVDEEVVATQILEKNTNTYPFRSDKIGSHVITITCGETVKTINATITELGIKIEPVTAGLVFDFNPIGKSNNDADRLWSYSGDNGNYSMTVSDNFDWVNGGYQLDENGEQYFCIKAGTNAIIDYKMFADDAKKTGKECKLVFKTTNVQEANAQFLSCIDNTTGSDHIGIEMFVHEAYIYGSAGKLDLPYAENEIIEFEFNINTNTDAVPEICGYEDGVPTRHLVYDDSFNFTQSNPKTIALGSDKCDLHIYRFKTYNTALNATGVLNNFIADARSADKMIERYYRNQIYNENQELTPEILAEKCPWLRVYKVSAPYFTNKKSDKVPYTTIQQIYKNGDPVLDNWTCYDCSHSGQGTSSDNYGASARNLDFIMNKSQIEGVKPYFILGDGKTREEKISLTRTSIPVAYLNFKANVASSNHFTNALLAKRYNEFNPYKLPYMREDESIIDYIKTTMEFHNAVVFIQETDTVTDSNGNYTTHREFNDCSYHFYSIGNIGDSKKTDKTRLVDPSDRYECVNEICDVDLPLSEWDNTPEAIAALEAEKFDKSGTYEWRYIWEDGTDEENAEVREYCKQKWIEMYKFVVQSSDEEFKANFENYFIKDSMLFYYLFTTRYCMIDNRAKNSFWHYGKTGETNEDGTPIRKWNLTMMYDCDSSMSLNNYGASVYRHGYEDTDVMDGTTEEVFRESKSTIFCRIRDLFEDELKEMYNTLESKNAWNAESFLNEIETWQAEFPEELWRLDTERKYIRTYNSSFINGAGDPQYLKNMAQGKMKYRVKQWERSQEAYMASKYQSSTASSDNIVLRCTVPDGDLVVPTNYRLKITPYDYMYLNVKYGTQEPIQVRANPGVQYEIPFEGESVDIIDIFSASRIQDLGDLSSTYPATVDTSKATRLKELHIGNSTEGYDNPSLTTMTLGANYLLEVLNVENVSGLTQSLNLSALNNLRELYAHGTNASGVTFANGGEIEVAELPAINTMTMRNLLYLTNLDIASLNNLTTLTIENCSSIDVKTIFEQAVNLNRVRVTGIDWVLTDTTLLEKIYKMSGLDKNGYNTDKSVLAGKVHVPVIRQQQLLDYQTAWNDLEITYDSMILQYAVTFVNYDGIVLEVQYVDKGEDAVDPTIREENKLIPTRESTVSHNFTFSGWDLSLKAIFNDRTITALYTESLREYTIKYVSKGITLQEDTGLYGENIPYTGDIPVYTLEESAYTYYLFEKWDKSGMIDGEKTINAVFDSCSYSEGYFEGKDISELRPVEIYAMTKLGLEASYVESKDSISLSFGNDYNYDDVESVEIISEKTVFNGSNYIDSGITLLDKDRDFVIAIDYKMSGDTTLNGTLVQCFQSNGTNGFRLYYNNGVKTVWGNTSQITGITNSREMLVLRHVKGESGLHVYYSNLEGTNVLYYELESTRSNITDTSTLVFGCQRADDGVYENFAYGEIHWAKVWYADLGDSACRDLSIWTHEKLTLEMCGFKNYYLSDNSNKRCSMTFLASNLLDKDRIMSNASNNKGGWAESTLNRFMNDRMYKAIEPKWRQLIKQVKVASSIGDKSTDLSYSDCYLTVPALVEVAPSETAEPYVYEGTGISYMSTNDSRIRSYDNGEAGTYWTRSPHATNASYFCRIDQDGSVYKYVYPNYTEGILVELSI